ncbi:MAG: TorF family putative porin [Steroidobacteraceae bacterium]
MKQVRVLSALGLLAVAGAANAGISSTITLTNDYDFRGVSQSAEDPALQASVDYADEKSGWYVGAWGSNVDFGNADLELDLYTGFTGKTDAGLGWDTGFVYYTYDEDRYNYPEIYAGLSYSFFKGKLSYTNDWGGRDSDGHASAFYLSADANVPLPVTNLSALGHIGRTVGGHRFDDYTGFGDYTDFSAGVSYKVQKFDLGLKVVTTDADPKARTDVGNMETRFVFTVATTLPW